MGFRFRKRISFGRFLRLNVSGSGVSLGLGPPGLNANIGRQGIRKTVGLPGSGLSYQVFSRWPRSEGAEQQTPTKPTPPETVASEAPRQPPSRFRMVCIVALLLGGIWFLVEAFPSARMATVAQPPTSLAFVVKTPQGGATESTAVTSPTRSSAATLEASPAPAVRLQSPPPNRSVSPIAPEPLTWDEVRELQSLLKSLGYEPGPLDGFSGPLTLQAVRRYAIAHGLSDNSEITREILASMRQVSSNTR